MHKIIMLLFSFWILTLGTFVHAKGLSVEECESRREKVTALLNTAQPESTTFNKDLENAQEQLDKCQPLFKIFQDNIPCDILNVEIGYNGNYYLRGTPYKKQITALELTPTEGKIVAKWRFKECASYWAEHPIFDRCYFLWEHIKFKSNSKVSEEQHKEFAKCEPLLQALEKEFPCEDFSRHKAPGNIIFAYQEGLVYKNEGPSLNRYQREILNQEKAEKIKKVGLSSSDTKRVEELRFYECVPQWKEEEKQTAQARKQQEKLAQQKKTQDFQNAKAKYFAKCPKGITTSSFDCYALDTKFVNYGFRGLPLRKLSREKINSWDGTRVLGNCAFATTKNMEVYQAEGTEEEMQLSVIDGVIATMSIILHPKGISPHAMHLTMKKRFPTIAEHEPGRLSLTKKNGQRFIAEKNVESFLDHASAEELEGAYASYDICYESALLEKAKRKEADSQLKKEEAKAQELF